MRGECKIKMLKSENLKYLTRLVFVAIKSEAALEIVEGESTNSVNKGMEENNASVSQDLMALYKCFIISITSVQSNLAKWCTTTHKKCTSHGGYRPPSKLMLLGPVFEKTCAKTQKNVKRHVFSILQKNVKERP